MLARFPGMEPRAYLVDVRDDTRPDRLNGSDDLEDFFVADMHGSLFYSFNDLFVNASSCSAGTFLLASGVLALAFNVHVSLSRSHTGLHALGLPGPLFGVFSAHGRPLG